MRALKETLGLTQPQAARLGALLDAGNYLGHPVTGWVYDRIGPQGSCSLAALLVGAAYGAIQLIVNRGGKSSLSRLVLGVAFFIVGLGSGLGYIAALGSTSKQFSDTVFVGRAVGVVAAGFGLSATLVALTYRWASFNYFFVVWAALVAAVNVVGAVGLRTRPRSNSGNSNPAPANVDQVVGIASARRLSSEDQQEEGELHLRQSYQILQSSSFLGSLEPGDLTSNGHSSNRDSNLSWTSWKRFEFWVLSMAFACLTGCGLFVINNMATVVQSFRNDGNTGSRSDSLAGGLVVLCSVCNCVGRLGMGVLVDKNTNVAKGKISLMQSAAFVMSAGLAVTTAATTYAVRHSSGDSFSMVGNVNISSPLASLLLSALAVTVALTAVSYGAIFVVIVAIINERFGNTSVSGGCAKGRHFGKDYGLILVGSALFGMVGNTLSAWMYQQHAENSSSNSGDEDDAFDVCFGAICYQGSFFLATVIAFCGGLLLQILIRHQGF